MLQKSRSKTISKMKYLILVPLMLLMLTYVACSEEPADNPVANEDSFELKLQQIKVIAEDGITAEEQEDINKILSTVDHSKMAKHMDANRTVVETEEISKNPEGVSFSVIEEVPVFPGCGDLSSNEARKNCTTQKITEVVSANFDTSLGKELGFKGMNRIYVQFRINADGNVEVLAIRAPHPALKAEAERVVNLIPQMEPGKNDGKEIGVLYALPISFKVAE